MGCGVGDFVGVSEVERTRIKFADYPPFSCKISPDIINAKKIISQTLPLYGQKSILDLPLCLFVGKPLLNSKKSIPPHPPN